MSNGQFIVIEGLEGAGKSTAVATVTQWLQERQIAYSLTREPGGTPLAEKLRELLKYYDEEAITPASELLMMYAARSQLLENKIKPDLAKGLWVVGDRHDLSSRAYQGGGRGIAMNKLDELRAITLGDFRPNLTLYLDIDPVQGLSRARERGALDRIEQQAIDFFQRARRVYQREVAADPKRIKQINAGADIEAVSAQIRGVLDAFYG